MHPLLFCEALEERTHPFVQLSSAIDASVCEAEMLGCMLGVGSLLVDELPTEVPMAIRVVQLGSWRVVSYEVWCGVHFYLVRRRLL